MEKGALTFPGGSTFPRWRGSNCIFLYKPIEFVIFQGAGVRTPATSSGSARGIVNWVRRHIFLAKNLAWHSLHWCKFCAAVVNNDRVLLFNNWRYDTLGYQICHEKGSAPCIKGVLCYGILYYSQRRMWRESLHIKYRIPTCFVPHCMRRSQMNLIARNAVSYSKSVSLPIRYDFLVIRLKCSPH